MLNHVRDYHLADLKKKKVTRLGICYNEHFIYANPEYRCQGDGIIVPGAFYYMDGEEDSASFSTDEDFGCVHHESDRDK